MGRSPVWQNSQSPRTVPAAARGPPVSSVNATSTPCRLNMPVSTPTHTTLWKVARNAMAVRVLNSSADLAPLADGQAFRVTAAVAATAKRLRVIERFMVFISGKGRSTRWLDVGILEVGILQDGNVCRNSHSLITLETTVQPAAISNDQIWDGRVAEGRDPPSAG